MPVITARVKLEWISGGWQPYASNAVSTQRSELMKELLEQIRSIAIRIVGVVDDVRYRLEDAVLEVHPVHQWSENVPDLKLEVRVNELGGSELERQERRWLIARDINGEIFHFLDQVRFDKAIKPAVAVECLPARSSGVSLGADGRLISNWGVPNYSDIPAPTFVPDRDEGRGDVED